MRNIIEMTIFFPLLVVFSSVLVLVDANRNGVKKAQIKRFYDMGYIGWFVTCDFLWIVTFQ